MASPSSAERLLSMDVSSNATACAVSSPPPPPAFQTAPRFVVSRALRRGPVALTGGLEANERCGFSRVSFVVDSLRLLATATPRRSVSRPPLIYEGDADAGGGEICRAADLSQSILLATRAARTVEQLIRLGLLHPGALPPSLTEAIMAPKVWQRGIVC